ncbi:CatB-related O-acetyltransferase [Glaciecola sp. MF2-115]|uniref:CatB-related O-acetyltransferase n=1 Tax=Glaciecola sp. MF2-115 TaxID=3384827 RepID=UPI00399EF2A0
MILNNLEYLFSRVLKKLRGNAIKNSHIDTTSKAESGSTIFNSNMQRHSYCGYDCSIINANIGSFVSIANNVSIGGSKHPMHFVSMSPVFLSHKDSVKKKYAKHDYQDIPRTEIGCDVWIGAGVFIKSGVKIGNGSVIGMGSVVTRDVPDYSVVAGNPAKLVRYRFEKNIIEKLLELQWWDFDDAKLERLGEFVVNPTEFIAQAVDYKN